MILLGMEVEIEMNDYVLKPIPKDATKIINNQGIIIGYGKNIKLCKDGFCGDDEIHISNIPAQINLWNK
jgi:hypothetical protein